MFSHIMVGANDIEESKTFYDNVLGVLGAKPGLMVPNLTGQTRYFYILACVLGYVVYDTVEKEHDRLQRKQPGQFDHET